MTITTRTEKMDAAKEVLNSKTSIRTFFQQYDSFDELEKLIIRIKECYEQAKAEEKRKEESFAAQKEVVKTIQDLLEEKGIDLDTFNKLANMQNNSMPKGKRSSPLAGRKIETQMGVFEYQDAEGNTVRTGLRAIKRRKPAGLESYMLSLGKDPKNASDCAEFLVRPNLDELDAYTGDASLIVYPE